MSQREDKILADYVCSFLRIKARPNEAIATTIEQIVGFVKLFRDGCHQDLMRLILRIIQDETTKDGKAALLAFGQCIEGEGVDLWGLPDCHCDEVDCVYCGPRIAKSVYRKL